MVTLVVLATVAPRVLGPGDYGRFAVPLTVVTLGSLALALGGPTIMARLVPAAPDDQRVALARALGARLARGRGAQLAALAGAALVAMVVAPGQFPPVSTTLVYVALALNVAATLALQVALGLGRTGPWSFRYPLQNAVLIVAVLVLHPLAGVSGTIVAIVVAAVVAAGLGAVVVAPILASPEPSVPVPAGAVRFGALHAAGAALVQFTHRGGVLAVALLAGSSVETGFTALAVGIALGATYAVLQTFTVSLPHLADGGEGAAETANAEAVLRRLAGALLVVLVPGALVVALALEPLVPALFGPDYQDAVSTFGPALGVVVLAPFNALAVQVAALRFRPGAALAAGIATVTVFVVAAAVAVPLWGAAGGTAATLAGVAAGALASLQMLPGAFGSRITVASFTGAAAAVALAAGMA